MVPIQVSFRNGWAKVKVALARGRKKYDKRERDAKRDAQSQIDRAIKGLR